VYTVGVLELGDFPSYLHPFDSQVQLSILHLGPGPGQCVLSMRLSSSSVFFSVSNPDYSIDLSCGSLEILPGEGQTINVHGRPKVCRQGTSTPAGLEWLRYKHGGVWWLEVDLAGVLRSGGF